MTYEDKIIGYRQYMVNVARRFYYNEDRIEDSVQDCVYDILRKYQRYDKANDNDLKNLIYSVIKNNYIDQYRKWQKNKVSTIEVSEYNDISNTDCTDSLVRVNEIKAMLKRLKPKERVIMQMLTLGYAYKDIVEQLGIPMGTVKATIHYIRNKKLSHA